MPTISKLQQRDLEALEALQPDYDFESAYLEYLQELRLILVAYHKNSDGIRHYFGFVNILWESRYTPFWRHKIAEIVHLYIGEAYRGQGIASELIKTIEAASSKKEVHKIGLRLEPVGEFASLQDLFLKLGYTEESFGTLGEEESICLVKSLP